MEACFTFSMVSSVWTTDRDTGTLDASFNQYYIIIMASCILPLMSFRLKQKWWGYWEPQDQNSILLL